MFVIQTHVESCCRVQLASMQNLLAFSWINSVAIFLSHGSSPISSPQHRVSLSLNPPHKLKSLKGFPKIGEPKTVPSIVGSYKDPNIRYHYLTLNPKP